MAYPAVLSRIAETGGLFASARGSTGVPPAGESRSCDAPTRDVGTRACLITGGEGTESPEAGFAQDYLVYAPEGRLAPGGTFRVHVRHLTVRATEEQLPARLDDWWAEFARDHERGRGLSTASAAQERHVTAPGS